jgi:hypothetical protein
VTISECSNQLVNNPTFEYTVSVLFDGIAEETEERQATAEKQSILVVSE